MGRAWQVWQAAAVLLAVAAPARAPAAWLGYRNDTPAVIVVQSASVIANQVRLGKPHILFPGEVAWDAVTVPGLRQISVFDPKQKNRLLHKDLINCQALDIFLSVQVFVPPAVKGQAVAQPQFRFVPARAPVMPGIPLLPGALPGTPGAAAPPADGPPAAPGTRPPTGGFTPPASPPTPPPSLPGAKGATPPAPPPAKGPTPPTPPPAPPKR
jgi:hypothetical protein